MRLCAFSVVGFFGGFEGVVVFVGWVWVSQRTDVCLALVGWPPAAARMRAL
jgi:hypothetical protein